MLQIVTSRPELAEAIADVKRGDLAHAGLTLLRAGYDVSGASDEICNILYLFRQIEEQQIGRDCPAIITYISYVMEEM